MSQIQHIMTIDGVKYYIPNRIMEKQHKHRINNEWVTLWFYKNRRQFTTIKKDVKIDKEITSKLEYKRDTFYKMTTLSEEDPHFDYFFKLKEEIKTGNVVKRNGRFTRTGQRKGISLNRKHEYGYGKKYEYAENGKVILKFR